MTHARAFNDLFMENILDRIEIDRITEIFYSKAASTKNRNEINLTSFPSEGNRFYFNFNFSLAPTDIYIYRERERERSGCSKYSTKTLQRSESNSIHPNITKLLILQRKSKFILIVPNRFPFVFQRIPSSRQFLWKIAVTPPPFHPPSVFHCVRAPFRKCNLAPNPVGAR